MRVCATLCAFDDVFCLHNQNAGQLDTLEPGVRSGVCPSAESVPVMQVFLCPAGIHEGSWMPSHHPKVPRPRPPTRHARCQCQSDHSNVGLIPDAVFVYRPGRPVVGIHS